MPMPKKFEVGDRIGMLTVLSLRKIIKGSKSIMFWAVSCDCGKVCEMRTNKIKLMADSGKASCGCQKKQRPKVGRRSCIARAHEMIEKINKRDPTPKQIRERCREIRIEKRDWFE